MKYAMLCNLVLAVWVMQPRSTQEFGTPGVYSVENAAMRSYGYSEFISIPEDSSGHPGSPMGVVRYVKQNDLVAAVNMAARNMDGEPGMAGHGIYQSFQATDHKGEQRFLGGVGARWSEDPSETRRSPELVFWILTEEGPVYYTFSRDGIEAPNFQLR